MPYTRAQWNDLLDEVNAVITNPPPDTDCEPRPALEHVGPDTIWRKSHIREVQNAIKATCADISFGDIPDRWEQSIIDEIREALGQAWCNCQDDDDNDCNQEVIAAEDGLEFLLRDNGPPHVVSPCLGNNTPDIPLRNLIDGMMFGGPNIIGRVWRAVRRNHYNDGRVTQSSPLASGILSCQGNVHYTGTASVTTTSGGVFVDCGTGCESSGCQETIAEAQITSQTSPNNFRTTFHLILDTQGAFCRVPGDDCPA